MAGSSVAVPVRAPDVSASASSFSLPNWRRLTQGSGILLILGFFLPWVTISCGGSSAASLTFSGFQLAAGPTINNGFTTQQLGSSPGLWLVLITGFLAFLFTYQIASRATAALSTLVAAVISLLIIFIVWSGYAGQRSALINVSLDLGFWLSVAGLAGMVWGALLGMKSSPNAEGRPDQ
ncbi:MAG: hypothetical protein ACREOS_08270 [Candidatus Dormibacteraceae bacterium]